MHKILVIDDETPILKLISRALSSQGYLVITATNGKQGLKMATKGWDQPNLIILDLHMQGMNGIEVLEKLKLHEKTCTIPVMVLTGLRDKEAMKTVISHYAMEYITKPISMPHLREKVASAIQKKPTYADKPLRV